jgi:hypothetical protein
VHDVGADVSEMPPVRQVVEEKIPFGFSVEVSVEQEVCPAPKYNILYAYLVDGFRQLPFRWQKEYAFRCGKALETDAFGEAHPLSEELKKSFLMQIDEFDREKRRRTANAQEAPPQKMKSSGRKHSSWQSQSHSCHASSQDFQCSDASPSPSAITSRLRDPVVSPRLPINTPCLPAAPPAAPPPAASDEALREGLDMKFIKDLLKEKGRLMDTKGHCCQCQEDKFAGTK